ncbi:hypothetical protein N9L68_06785 [bacterium]|nr:hypothetical protein [bacterium]
MLILENYFSLSFPSSSTQPLTSTSVTFLELMYNHSSSIVAAIFRMAAFAAFIGIAFFKFAVAFFRVAAFIAFIAAFIAFIGIAFFVVAVFRVAAFAAFIAFFFAVAIFRVAAFATFIAFIGIADAFFDVAGFLVAAFAAFPLEPKWLRML